jgi:hypothetical protein
VRVVRRFASSETGFPQQVSETAVLRAFEELFTLASSEQLPVGATMRNCLVNQTSHLLLDRDYVFEAEVVKVVDREPTRRVSLRAVAHDGAREHPMATAVATLSADTTAREPRDRTRPELSPTADRSAGPQSHRSTEPTPMGAIHHEHEGLARRTPRRAP